MVLLARSAAPGPPAASGPLTEVVVELAQPAGRSKAIAAEQTAVERRIVAAVPTAKVRWRYRIVLNGLAVVVPQGSVSRLNHVSGVRQVYPSVRYAPALDRSVHAIHAPTLWGPTLATSGQGLKIGIIDDGLDQKHPFFSPSAFTMPPGYPKGDAAYTTAKVIAARVFPAISPRPKNSNLPFDPDNSEHATHVAGIAAGNAGTRANVGGGTTTLSGVAPSAYLGNYRVLTVPTISGVGLDGNSPEIAAGIEAAVRDGMNVINLSLGEPEVIAGRDLVTKAIEGAARAGVVPVISAGNDYGLYGLGSISSPGAAPAAITAAASTIGSELADFSSAGPTPLTLAFKPDITAPGVSILSSVPARRGLWAAFSGTSMAAPHIAGGAALLKQRHPTWTVAEIKSALTLTSQPAFEEGGGEALSTREGAGFVDLARADQPLLFARPTGLSFGFLHAGRSASRQIAVTDAGGGAGEWTVSIARQRNGAGVTVSAPAKLAVPGTLTVRAAAGKRAREGEVTGFVVLDRGPDSRRIPFWARLTAPRLGRQPARVLRRTGVYSGNTRGRKALVSVYRYPDDPRGAGLRRTLAGPEQVFRVRLRRAAANLGVALLTRSRVQPRIVLGADENRQAGSPALPLVTNPYLPGFFAATPSSAVIAPTPGTYSVVFDSPSRSGAGRFRFRFWIDDKTPPRLRLLTPSIAAGGTLRANASDRGAGVDPKQIFVRFDEGRLRRATFRNGTVRIPVGSLGRGVHRLTLQVSDYQEAKNMENVPRILPNTATLTAQVRVR